MNIITADYRNPAHAKAISNLMQAYASDPFGGGEPLPETVSDNLAAELAKRDFAFSLLGYIDNEAVALVNCFELFSTFAGKPIVNIHDIMVTKAFRGRGLSRQLLSAVETIARERDCCKLTLEVLSNNHIAKASYTKFGFGNYQLNPEHGHALYWQKNL